MGKINSNAEFVEVILSPEELLYKTVPCVGPANDHPSFMELIIAHAWKQLWVYGKKLAEEKVSGKAQPKQFKYKTCDFVDGNYVARFWLKEPAKVPAEPAEV